MKDKLDLYIDRVEHLPPTPAILVRLISLFRQPDRDVDEIVELIRRDPSLTTEVLRYSNSAHFGHDECILDVFEATMRVGFYKVYQTAVARIGLEALSLPQRTGSINMAAICRHSAAAAATAGAIARRVGEPEGLAFTAGLLHDVGKIVLASAEGAQYGRLINDLGESGSSLERSESKLFGFGHGEVGARLLIRWGLPADISAPVGSHHRVAWAAPFERLCAVVTLGDSMAHAHDADTSGEHYDSEEALCAMRLLQLGEGDVAALLQEAQTDIERFTGMLAAEAR